mmetsp:Transcript_242/g.403  ORF Transcript_242/g.403 Transcript_242/m.403 type:complete len:450 (+) Transcript_242:163-1512(+)|eukprot:CAMPEP_0184541132 /NCGR_PEP_ID=MMETSP0199_2-20130426/1210_1 /TAXON_ID=1112570 /ORGANISM="Thraustochytrium sp., Strain LLF1b" /LENGTH=449 /DNA_ID=CAMNT_0026934841 /DNA_START=118 /DNA_END=1467 /DNA_ORIENTATION=+
MSEDEAIGGSLDAPLSSRGLRMRKPALSYLKLYFEAMADAFDMEKNPGGCIPLAVAENKLSFDELIRPRVAQAYVKQAAAMAEGKDIVPPFYGDPRCHISVRKAMSGLLELLLETPASYQFNPENIVISTGVTGLLDKLSWALFEENDSCIIPSPFYSAFPSDLGSRSSVNIIPATQKVVHKRFSITKHSLHQALKEAKELGQQPRAVMITNPQNPSGTMIPEDELEMVLLWARKHGLHVIADEIYAKVVHSPEHGPPFVSMATVALRLSEDGTIGDDVHILHGFSKAYALSGLRVGVMYSENEPLIEAMQGLCNFSCLSSQTQEIVLDLASDLSWNEEVLEKSAQQLREACDLLMGFLKSKDIPFIRPTAGLFLLADFSSFLPADVPFSFQAEEQMIQNIFDETRVLVTPGASCSCEQPGWVRICYPSVSRKALEEAIERLGDYADRL